MDTMDFAIQRDPTQNMFDPEIDNSPAVAPCLPSGEISQRDTDANASGSDFMNHDDSILRQVTPEPT